MLRRCAKAEFVEPIDHGFESAAAFFDAGNLFDQKVFGVWSYVPGGAGGQLEQRLRKARAKGWSRLDFYAH